MKIFISWSDDRSKHIANTFRWWLPNVIQAVEPFISTQDIEKGTRGTNTISRNLEESSFGLICLTPENQDKPWILFEAGALSKQSSALVYTFLFDMTWTQVKPPLSIFQHTNNSKEDILSLCRSINSHLSLDRQLTTERLKESFDVWYPALEGKLAETPKLDDVERSKLAERSEKSMLEELLQLMRAKEDSVPTKTKRNVSDSLPFPSDPLHLLLSDLYNNRGYLPLERIANHSGLSVVLDSEFAMLSPQGDVTLTDKGTAYISKILKKRATS